MISLKYDIINALLSLSRKQKIVKICVFMILIIKPMLCLFGFFFISIFFIITFEKNPFIYDYAKTHQKKLTNVHNESKSFVVTLATSESLVCKIYVSNFTAVILWGIE